MLLKGEGQKAKCIPEVRGDQMIFTKQNSMGKNIENMSQWSSAFHMFVSIYC